MPLHLSDVRRVARVAKLFVEHAQKYLQDCVAIRFGIGLCVDIEKDDIGSALHGALNICEKHGVFDFLVIEELRCTPLVARLRVGRFEVFKQVRQYLDEVRLA